MKYLIILLSSFIICSPHIPKDKYIDTILTVYLQGDQYYQKFGPTGLVVLEGLINTDGNQEGKWYAYNYDHTHVIIRTYRNGVLVDYRERTLD